MYVNSACYNKALWMATFSQFLFICAWKQKCVVYSTLWNNQYFEDETFLHRFKQHFCLSLTHKQLILHFHNICHQNCFLMHHHRVGFSVSPEHAWALGHMYSQCLWFMFLTGGLWPAAKNHPDLVPQQEASGAAAGGQQGDHQGCSEPQWTG